jgi:hypothetical protein
MVIELVIDQGDSKEGMYPSRSNLLLVGPDFQVLRSMISSYRL